jgi:hypothetical protein
MMSDGDFDPDEVDSADVDWMATAGNLQRAVIALRRELRGARQELARFTDDTCYGRCDSPEGLLAWFQHETRACMCPEEAHEVLDMVLNKLKTEVPE